MPGVSQRKFYTTIRGPSAEALDLLGPKSAHIWLQWNQELKDTGLQASQLVASSQLDFAHFANTLRDSDYPEFRRRIQELGEGLARKGISLSEATAALHRLCEICMRLLMQNGAKRASPILALARLYTLIEVLAVSGYTGQWASGRMSLVEASLEEAEERQHGASVYITRIYEQERRRLSRDLHDEIGHDLMLVKLYLEMMAIEQKGSEGAQPRLAEALALVSHAIEAVRRIVLDLGPAVFEDIGFLPAVRSYITQFSARTKIHIALQEGHLPKEIPSTHQVALYRILQGALSNILRHASASNVKVSLGSMKESMLIMIIEDDGTGFDTHVLPRYQSFGMTAMRERVEALGGRFHVQSKPVSAGHKMHGTRIEVDLPLSGKEVR